MKQRNFMLFMTSCALLSLGWLWWQNKFYPSTETTPKPEDKTPEVQAPPLPLAGWDAFADQVVPPPPPLKGWDALAELVVPPGQKTAELGSMASNSPFHLHVVIDPRGAGVRSVTLNKFPAYTRNDYADPAAESKPKPPPRTTDGGKPAFEPLELVPEAENTDQASFLLYHFDPNDNGLRPLDTLGVVTWHQVGEVDEEKNDQGQVIRQSVAFEYVLDKEDVKITKLFSLKTGEYHIGLEVTLERLKPRAEDSSLFRYQLAGAHGLPIEGKWYTNTFRNAVILRTDKDKSPYRNLEESRQIGVWGGGTPILKEPDRTIRYAGVSLQFFASVVVVSDEQIPGTGEDFLSRAAPTLEKGVTKGIVKQLHENRTFTLEAEGREDKDKDIVFHVPSHLSMPAVNMPVAVISSVDGKGHDVVRSINPEPGKVHPVWENDITVRVTTERLKLTPENKVVHRYVLYNGPVKPRLLAQMTDVNAVDPAVLDRYKDSLGLRTLTDYQSNGWMGSIAGTIGWTWLMIQSTNMMHFVLGWMHRLVPNLGLSIILLTVMVRAMMFPISRKGALTSLRMQELAPELAKIKEKFGEDRQGAGAATWALYSKHGISPFGTCWFMLLQMPIFMGLYFALQESITFRLAPFWPTWIENLAAPDMVIPWSEKIPFISRVQDYGSYVFLGPYLNILPIVAVILMVIQQKMVTPPPADEQQEMQQKMMKYMMVIMGFMFYKVVAGLTVYFIASSIWGFTERALLPKKKKTKPEDSPKPNAGTTAAATAAVSAAPALDSASKSAYVSVKPGAGVTDSRPSEQRGRGRKQGRNKRNRSELGKPAATPAPVQAPPPTGPLGRLRSWMKQKRESMTEWWRDILEQAEKKNRTERKK